MTEVPVNNDTMAMVLVSKDLIDETHQVHALTIEDSNSDAYRVARNTAFQLANNPGFQEAIHTYDTGLQAILENNDPSLVAIITDQFQNTIQKIATNLGIKQGLNSGIIANATTAVRVARQNISTKNLS